MNDVSQDLNLWFIFAAISIFSLFCTGLYFILRYYTSKDALDYSNNENLDSKDLVKETVFKSDANKVSLKDALSKSRRNFWEHITFAKSSAPQAYLEQIEEALYLGDVGPQTVTYLVDRAEKYFNVEKLTEDSLKHFLKDEMESILGKTEMSQSVYSQLRQGFESVEGPIVLMVVGVNGVGKTTTIGKLAQNLAEEGKKVLIAAGDTFRAAAGEQLKVWTDRANAEIFFPEGVKDPSAVAFDALKKAESGGFDVCLIDTAGRLHTQDNLMAELEKVKRILSKINGQAPHHTWIVLDANSGQNALFQAKNFHKILNLSGVILTKLDGTAKGGMALAVANELNVPIRFIGVGEKAQDLRPFNSLEFVDSLI